jgi:FKBP-type peptidyl-prolyl cis-trans isomerase
MVRKPGIKLLSETKGTGDPVKKGDTVTIRLNGWLNQGQQIQENYVGEVVVGGRKIIPGIDYSIEGMRRGGKRKVKISPHLGYRKVGVENRIPANAVLVFEIEVLDVKRVT